MYKPFSKGRWYKFFIESDGTEFTLTDSDIGGVSIDSILSDKNALSLPLGYKILSVVPILNSIEGNELESIVNIVVTSTGQQAYLLPPATSFSDIELYVFAVRNQEGV